MVKLAHDAFVVGCGVQFLRNCQLCKQEFGELDEQCPRLLPCGHVYCGPCCLSSRIDHAALACPFPDCTCVMPVERAAALPKHWAVLDAVAAAAPAVAPVMCACEAEEEAHPAMYHCSKCGKDFCDALTTMHKRHGGTLTPIVAGQGPLARVISTMCQEHDGHELALYCFTCKRPVCVICGQLSLENGGHAGHNVNTTSKAVDVCLVELDKAREDAQSQCLSLQHAMHKIQAVMAQLSARRSAADLKVDATCNEVWHAASMKVACARMQTDRVSSIRFCVYMSVSSCATKWRPFAHAASIVCTPTDLKCANN